MKRDIEKMTKYATEFVLVIWFAISFLALIGDETPGNPMSTTSFLIFKALAFGSLAAAYYTARALSRAGKLPKDKRTDDIEDDYE